MVLELAQHFRIVKMFKNLKNIKTGFSLVEVLVASILFLITVAGLFAAFSQSRVNSEHVDKRLQAAYIGRQVLEELRAKVDQRTWDVLNSDLSLGSHSMTRNIFIINYVVSEDASYPNTRKVVMNITWTE